MLFVNMDNNILKNRLVLLKKIEVHYIFINYLFGPKYTKMTQSNYFICATGPI